jgi:hypothetical protein
MWIKWNQVRWYCGHWLTYFTSPGWQMVMIEGQLVEWVSGKANQSTLRNPALMALCPPQTRLDQGPSPFLRSGKPAVNRMRYCKCEHWHGSISWM